MGFIFVCFVRAAELLQLAPQAVPAQRAVEEQVVPALHIQPLQIVERTGE